MKPYYPQPCKDSRHDVKLSGRKPYVGYLRYYREYKKSSHVFFEIRGFFVAFGCLPCENGKSQAAYGPHEYKTGEKYVADMIDKHEDTRKQLQNIITLCCCIGFSYCINTLSGFAVHGILLFSMPLSYHMHSQSSTSGKGVKLGKKCK